MPKGTDLQVTAQLNGFNSELVEVVTRRGANTEWERIPMGLGSDTVRFSARLFDLDADVEYYIEIERRPFGGLQADGAQPARRAHDRPRVALSGVHRAAGRADQGWR